MTKTVEVAPEQFPDPHNVRENALNALSASPTPQAVRGHLPRRERRAVHRELVYTSDRQQPHPDLHDPGRLPK
jgi:hypothetical protein